MVAGFSTSSTVSKELVGCESQMDYGAYRFIYLSNPCVNGDLESTTSSVRLVS